jgi:hypothetical protein
VAAEVTETDESRAAEVAQQLAEAFPGLRKQLVEQVKKKTATDPNSGNSGGPNPIK